MNNQVSQGPKNKPRKGVGKKKVIIGIIALVVIVAGVYFFRGMDSPQIAGALQTGVVTRGDLSQNITGSGSLAPLEKFEVISTVNGDIIRDYIEEGQTIKAGDLLYEISHDNIDNNIAMSRLSLERTENAHKDLLDELKYLEVFSTASGNINEIFVKEGDSVQDGSQIAKIINNDSVVVKVPFVSSVAENFYVGQSARIFLSDLLVYLDGSVSRIASGSRVVDNYTQVTDLEITINNPGNVASGQEGWVTIGGKDSPYVGSFENGEEEIILAKTGGKVEKVNYKVGDSIRTGELLARLENKNMDSTIANSELSIKEAKLSLANLYDQLDSYRIKSPINGTVLQKNSKAGDTLGNSTNNSNVLAVIVDMTQMTFTINVDELDITSIKKGQRVEITADATPEANYVGYVNNISMIGASENGVTTYPVEVVIEDFGQLMPGMNVNAIIQVAQAQNTLMIPVSALERGNIVMVKKASVTTPDGQGAGMTEPDAADPAQPDQDGDGGTQDSGSDGANPQQAINPNDFEPVSVEVGISNNDFVEILSGLSEGDLVLLTNFAANPGDMGGMMGGGVVVVSN